MADAEGRIESFRRNQARDMDQVRERLDYFVEEHHKYKNLSEPRVRELE